VFVRYDITHATEYRYARPVSFGEHRVMFRPRDSHDLRVLATDLQVTPAADIRLIQDSHSNSVALVQPRAPGERLRIVCTFTIEHARSQNLELPVLARADVFPIAYTVDERFDLELYMRPHHDDPGGELTAWAQRFVVGDGQPRSPRAALVAMNRTIREQFLYAARDEEGVQTPHETLERRSGSCRDFALLMMEAARRLGMAARFVSGYLYDPALDQDVDGDGSRDIVGAGATHAWLQVYLPGAGWVPFDPTNNLLGGTELIRVGVARHPAQAAPISGTWFGEPDAYLGMQVDVQVSRLR
jgi:transglutaminase-like putative cysteine protease